MKNTHNASSTAKNNFISLFSSLGLQKLQTEKLLCPRLYLSSLMIQQIKLMKCELPDYKWGKAAAELGHTLIPSGPIHRFFQQVLKFIRWGGWVESNFITTGLSHRSECGNNYQMYHRLKIEWNRIFRCKINFERSILLLLWEPTHENSSLHWGE